ncbi:LacI family DNA-binding transcriptional regulator [Roseobacter sp. CCS2]|uniref:LacI family DNA-binding transcriptional regulator n=1 Tax=Roseobacter sp. CCS2 TaxID=391593 RepID=UPI0000F3DFEA|nr:LacI family DNA-binding transcriptional regulator [Roseobacter sp. CCS2]EBA12143.1 transcriptional regulator, LacI family protein [Roseobacter sp. CCS2]
MAEAAKVSTATVSRCLNFPDKVAPETRQKVQDAIALLGYSPNFGARVMAARRTNTIGAIIPTMENAIFARGLEAFQEELRRHGFTMLVASTAYQPQIEEEQIRSLVARGADALLLIGYQRAPEIYRFLDAQRIPVLLTWAFDPQSPRPSVGFDNRAAMQGLAAKVIALGHRRLALISADTGPNDRAAARRDGILRAMAAAGLDGTQLRFEETTYGIDQGAAAFDRLMAMPDRPTAVFCGNDVLAVGALRSARALGLSVPQDVSVLGFDDIELAQVAYPALTTVHVPHREMGRRAGQALGRLLRDGEPIKPVELATRIVLRDTLGPA